MEADLPAVELGIQHVGGAEPERVHAAVRYLDGADELRIDGGLHAPGQFGVDDFGIDACALAGFDEGFLISQVIFRQGDEQAFRFFYTVGGDLSQDPVLADALLGRFRVVYGVARSGMQQAVVAAAGPGGDVGPLDQEGAQSAHGAVPLRPRSRDPSADDDDVEVVVGGHSCRVICYKFTKSPYLCGWNNHRKH